MTANRLTLADRMDLDLVPWMEGCMSVEEACRFLAISPVTLWRHVRDGLVKSSKLGGRRVFSRKDLAEALARGAM